MRKIIKFIALFLIALTIFSLVSCGSNIDEDIPDGMQIASKNGDVFTLYVPQNWILNTNGGVSSAYITVQSGVSIFASSEKTDKTLDDYYKETIESYKLLFKSFIVENEENITVDKNPAKKIKFIGLYEETNITFLRVFTIKDGNAITISYRAYGDNFDMYLDTANEVISNFKLKPTSVKESESNTKKYDKEGFNIASNADVEFVLYLPKTWTANSNSSIAGGILDDKSNISFIPYDTQVSMSIDDFIVSCETEYQKLYSNYEKTEEKEITMANKVGKQFTYKFSIDDIDYKAQQSVIVYRQRFYILTYTALAENFDSHLTDVDSIISEVIFR